MHQFVDIANRTELNRLLSALQPDTIPLWGSMNAQHMVEHLINELEFTNGKRNFVFDVPADEAAASKKMWIYTDLEIPKNLILSPPPVGFRYADLDTAKDQLLTELDDFDRHFKQPNHTENHGAYGAMNYNEWVTWIGKHFTHHFKQFGLTN